jgi:hypothetical protein
VLRAAQSPMVCGRVARHSTAGRMRGGCLLRCPRMLHSNSVNHAPGLSFASNLYTANEASTGCSGLYKELPVPYPLLPSSAIAFLDALTPTFPLLALPLALLIGCLPCVLNSHHTERILQLNGSHHDRITDIVIHQQQPESQKHLPVAALAPTEPSGGGGAGSTQL